VKEAINYRVTILIPTYNRANLINRTIENCFEQTFKKFKIIIYDDGSTDDTAIIIKKLQIKYPNRIKYIKGKINNGVGFSRNILLKNLTTEYGVWLDSDDIMDSNRLYKCIKYMNRHKDVSIVYSYISRFTEIDGIFTTKGSEIKLDTSKFDKTDYNSLKSNTTCATAFFRNTIKNVEIELLRYGSEDVLWLWKILNMNIKVGQISESLYFYRVHNDRLGIEKRTKTEKKRLEDIIIFEKINEYRNG